MDSIVATGEETPLVILTLAETWDHVRLITLGASSICGSKKYRVCPKIRRLSICFGMSDREDMRRFAPFGIWPWNNVEHVIFENARDLHGPTIDAILYSVRLTLQTVNIGLCVGYYGSYKHVAGILPIT